MRNKLFLLALLMLSTGITNAFAQEAKNQSQPKIISAGVVNGKAQSLPKPIFPAAAQAVRASGKVNVQVTIDEEGNVVSATAVSGHPLLRASAVEAAKQAKFTPTTLQGQPVKVTGVIVYNFVPPLRSEPNYEVRLKFLALGAVLSMARIDEFVSKGELADDLPIELSDFATELEPIRTLHTLSAQEREQTLNQIYNAVSSKLSAADAAELELGRLFGDIVAEVAKGKEDKSYQANEAIIKQTLLKIKSSLDSLETDFPKEVLDQFVLLTNFAEKPNLTSEDNLTTLMFRVMRIIEVVSPDNFK